ncbi:MAG TPA: class I SAM-dependent methyltransferase [Ktedonosporobacter sp.]|jgi:2-polyprenyl-3-methyl-5-hydroxy-6-metoxy-1,4-benzoquinol methylase|nr:class I SAM-dependent methyltransferase [Ktedonosporobacter sp.]
MLPKPEHLSFEYAKEYQDQTVVAAYKYRPPYPAEIYDLLVSLIHAEKSRILDIGCGLGDIARPLATRVAQIDAIDASTHMITLGKTLPGGDNPSLHWICGRVENVTFESLYELITAGESLHWMDWELIFPRFHALLAPGGYLALAHRWELSNAWTLALNRLIIRYSTYQSYKGHDIVHELQRRKLFTIVGQHRTAPVNFHQSVDDYLTGLHSRNGLSCERLHPEDRAAFDHAVRKLLAPFAQNNMLSLKIMGEVIWGTPVFLYE